MRPSTMANAPLLKYLAQFSAALSHTMILCQATSFLFASREYSLVARENLATALPLGIYLSSGSLPKKPARMILFIQREPPRGIVGFRLIFATVWRPRVSRRGG